VKATKVNADLAESNGRLLLGIWRDSLNVTCGLTACTPGSAPGPTLGNEYGKTLPFLLCCCGSRMPYIPLAAAATVARPMLRVCYTCMEGRSEFLGFIKNFRCKPLKQNATSHSLTLAYYISSNLLFRLHPRTVVLLYASCTLSIRLHTLNSCLQCFDAVGWVTGRASCL